VPLGTKAVRFPPPKGRHLNDFFFPMPRLIAQRFALEASEALAKSKASTPEVIDPPPNTAPSPTRNYFFTIHPQNQ